MKIIFAHSQKGGVSKTAVAFMTGVELTLAGHETLLIDLDPQKSLTTLCELRDDDKKLSVMTSTFAALPDLLKKAKEAELDYVIVDFPPHAGAQFEQVKSLADLVIVPCKNGSTDILSITQTIHIYDPSKTKLLISDVPSKEISAFRELLNTTYDVEVFETALPSSDAIKNALKDAESPSERIMRWHASRILKKLIEEIKQ